MTQSICPGQDTRFWQADDVFEVACAECGYEIEFFKDDAMRRCRSCGARVANPKMSLGCAQWCEHAEKCLGYDPKKEAGRVGGETDSLTDRAIAALREVTGGDKDAMAGAMETLETAQRLLRTASGDPKVVQLSAVLAGLDQAAAGKTVDRLNLDPATADWITRTLKAVREGHTEDSAEAALVARAMVGSAAPDTGDEKPTIH